MEDQLEICKSLELFETLDTIGRNKILGDANALMYSEKQRVCPNCICIAKVKPHVQFGHGA